MIKRIFAIVAVVGVAFMGACDDGGGDPVNPLLGTWVATGMEATTLATTEGGGFSISVGSTSTLTESDYQIVVTDNTITASGSYSVELTVSIAGFPPTTTTLDFEDVNGTANYTVSGNVLNVDGSYFDLDAEEASFDQGGATGEVTYSINGNQLTLTQDQTFTFTEDGATVTASITQTSTWERQ